MFDTGFSQQCAELEHQPYDMILVAPCKAFTGFSRYVTRSPIITLRLHCPVASFRAANSSLGKKTKELSLHLSIGLKQ